MGHTHKVLAGFFLGSFALTYGYLLNTETILTFNRVGTASQQAEIIFVGDIMLDRTIWTILEKEGADAVFGEIRSSLKEADFVVGNLEGPITHFASESVGTLPGEEGNTRFTFNPSVAAILADVGFKILAIGNNHIADFGQEGIAETKKYLEAVDITPVGDPFVDSVEPVLETVRGIKIGFAAYDEFINSDAEKTRATITRASEAGADFVVVLAHWGDEYESAPPPRIRQLAATFAGAGADLIIGTHSHVIGEVEDIGTTRVYYSLGNFIFDQYWDASVRCGLVVSLTLTKTGATTTASYREQKVGLLRSGATVINCSSDHSA
ncbi:MAG: CapA family protein [bacterium]|nr:CapA family protein [bacterium]